MHNSNENKRSHSDKHPPEKKQGPDKKDLKGKKVDAFPDHEEDKPVNQSVNKEKEEKEKQKEKAFREGIKDDNTRLDSESEQITNQDTTIVNEEDQQKRLNKD